MTIPTEADVTILIYELCAHILLHHLGHALSVSLSKHLCINTYVVPCTFISCAQVRLEWLPVNNEHTPSMASYHSAKWP